MNAPLPLAGWAQRSTVIIIIVVIVVTANRPTTYPIIARWIEGPPLKEPPTLLPWVAVTHDSMSTSAFDTCVSAS
ncbi:hypothetical protein CTA1_619 [Colletotrichum tanaceti]|uniref:Uncharacterized protein n=1 Tax=Colletotrichum tanaceti TaxID=1306861 RepID=A0A4U6XSJ1_9PEZI|nr:hypothetical protein CTA1_619 [Colletotrichum tanaceti]